MEAEEEGEDEEGEEEEVDGQEGEEGEGEGDSYGENAEKVEMEEVGENDGGKSEKKDVAWINFSCPVMSCHVMSLLTNQMNAKREEIA